MPLIHILDEPTINQIAAGEVVERPSAVVKELIENAMDAGATAITAEIKEGGLSFIRITDNGAGIAEEDIPLAFLRHATSKIRSAEDLLSVTSLGFRGEALSSIAAVSQLELITKTPSALNGFRYFIEGGLEKSIEEIGCPGGTTIIVRNLFFNTPARRKFLKSEITEAGYISELMERLMVSHPGITFKFIMNNQVKLQSTGNYNCRDILYQVYGRDIVKELLTVELDSAAVKINGFIGKPVINRGNRNYENYFINGRYIKSGIITKAIEEAYRPFLMQHKYPFTSLYFEISPDLIDVNVHPQKMEIRLKNGEEMYQSTCQAIKNALSGKELIPKVVLTPRKEEEKKTIAMPEPFEANRKKQFVNADNAQVSSSQKDKRTSELMQNGNLHNYDGTIGSLQKGNSKNHDRASGSTQYGNSQDNNVTSESPQNDHSPNYNRASEIPQNDNSNSQHGTSGLLQKSTSQVNTGASDIYQNNSAQENPDDRNDITSINDNRNINDIQIIFDIQSDKEIKTKNYEYSQENLSIPTDKIAEDSEYIRAKKQVFDGEKSDTGMIASGKIRQEFNQASFLEEKAFADHRIIGQVFSTYWLVEYGKELYIIDQHAAHEKVLYERLMSAARTKTFSSQQLFPPIVLTLGIREQEILRRFEDVFHSLGYEFEHFGGNEYSVRAVPADLYGISEKELLLEFIDEMAEEFTGNFSNTTSLLEKAASLSCKAAVKANHSMTREEAQALIKELLKLENPYHCPHGRPVIISMSQYELERKFKRII